jgi:type I restriction enzyme S subunit
MDTTETVVGHVPTSWPIHTLESLAAFITKGGTPTTYGHDWADASTGIPFFRSECVTDNGFDPKGMNFISPAAHQQMVRSEVKPGDLLMTITGNVGRVAKAPEEFATANINQHIARIRVLGTPDADADYVYHCLKHDGYAAHYRSILTGQAYPQISLQQVRETPLALPPVAERRKIAAILTAVDDKLDVIARQIEATQTLKQGLMQTLFSRGFGTQDADGRWVPHAEQKPSALGMVPSSWVVEPLDQYVSKVGSGVTPKGGSTSYQSSGVPLIRSQNVLVGRLSLDDVAYIDGVQHNKMRNSALEPEDVLLNITGASIGRCAVLPRDISEGNVNQHVCIIRTLPSLNPQFLCQYINSSFGQKQVAKFQAGGNREGLNYQQVRSFDVPVPSVAEQEKIVDLLEAVDGKVRCLERKQLQHQTLKRGLMQKLLTGEWRVKVDTEMAA